MRGFVKGSALAVAAALVAFGPAEAQRQTSVGASALFQGYSFDEALGTEVANLLMFPVAARLVAGERFDIDVFTAWAEGRVEQSDNVFVLNGVVDTRVRASLQATPWAILSVSANLPTGNETQNSEEAVVAAVLSSDLLGFNESSWGQGGAITSGVATAQQIGSWAIGLGASYRVAQEFEPQADTAFQYQPGNEARFRLALDRNVGQTGKLTGGFTMQFFDTDQVDGRNLFAAGNRMRGDLSYAFRAGSSTLNFFAADVYREEGDLSLQIINDQGAIQGDTLLTTGAQNLFVGGLQMAIPVGSTVYFRPTIDFRMQTIDQPAGEPERGGWMAGIQGELPLRIMGVDFFPRARFSLGKLKDDDGIAQDFWGFEGGATLRFR